MKKFLILAFIPLALGACTFGQKVSNTASEAASDAGTLVNKATGVTDTAIKKAADLQFATARAKQFYSSLVAQGEDLANGPCLSDNLTSGWVADLVHNPRLDVDNKFENQCPSYVNGTAKHFVELDLQGNFVRAE
ncbi:MAG: hypothetical protein AAB445_01595 [Patescibacteria group bacterium]